MTELSFAKSFLSLLDSRPRKLQADYALPPADLEITTAYTLPRMPQESTMRKPDSNNSTSGQQQADQSTPSSVSTVTITLKSTRNPVLSVTLPSTNIATTSVLDLKEQVAQQLGTSKTGGAGKVRILYAKKPATPDSKTVKEVLGGEEGIRELVAAKNTSTTSKAGGGGGSGSVKGELEVEFGVMVMGYKAPTTEGDPLPQQEEGLKGAAGAAATSGPEEVGKEEEDDLSDTGPFWTDLRGFLAQRIRNEKRAGEMLEAFQEGWKRR